MINPEVNLVTLSDLHHKYVEGYDELASIINGFKGRQYRVSATIGTWDVLHIGHLRYLTNARRQGDILVVGVDTDAVVKRSKGDLRPIIPYRERIEMLAYQACVDLITPLDDIDENGVWQYGLLRALKPHVFVAEETSYSDSQLADIGTFCDEVVVLPRQATGTSSTLIMQNLVKRNLERMLELANERPL